jgi:5'-3' exonuclease
MKNVILFDFNNLAVRTFFVKEIGAATVNPDYGLWRFMTFDSVYKSLFRVKEANEIVLAVDDRKSWRKLYWKRYKESRKIKRDTSNVDWPSFYRELEDFVLTIKDNIPVKVLRIDNAEADDVIATLCMNRTYMFTIISTDEDFLQLSSPAVKIYNPRKQEYVICEDTHKFIITKSLTGQSKDDIFNIKTPLDWGLTPETLGKRKPGFGPKSAEKVMKGGLSKLDEWLKDNDLEERFKVNRVLMDFNYIPKVLQRRILDEYSGYEYPNPENMYGFCKRYGFRGYTENFQQFENTFLKMYN